MDNKTPGVGAAQVAAPAIDLCAPWSVNKQRFKYEVADADGAIVAESWDAELARVCAAAPDLLAALLAQEEWDEACEHYAQAPDQFIEATLHRRMVEAKARALKLREEALKKAGVRA